MADRAQVTSVEAIEAFRAKLILFLSKARPTLEEVSIDVVRTRLWLQIEQRRHWDNELRSRGKKLERAQGELLSSRLSALEDPKSAQLMAVRRAQDAVREAEAKMAALKKWDRELENRSEPFVKQVNQLQDYVTTDMARAVAYLTEVIKTLEAYAGIPRPSVAREATQNVPAKPPEDGGDKKEGAAQ